MGISDWSSDVCSSDLVRDAARLKRFCVERADRDRSILQAFRAPLCRDHDVLQLCIATLSRFALCECHSRSKAGGNEKRADQLRRNRDPHAVASGCIMIHCHSSPLALSVRLESSSKPDYYLQRSEEHTSELQ